MTGVYLSRRFDCDATADLWVEIKVENKAEEKKAEIKEGELPTYDR